MLRLMKMQEFAQNLLDQPDIADKAKMIIEAIPGVRSSRLSDISHKLPACPDADYKSKILTRDAAEISGQG